LVLKNTEKRGGLKRAFSHRNFTIYCAGNFPSQVGVWAQRTALGWLAWKMTDSALYVGLLGFCDLIPILILSPFSGYLTDRFDRVLLGKIITALNVLVTASLFGLAILDLLTIELLLLFAFLTGVDHAMYQPVRSTIISMMVPRVDLSAGIAINSFSWNSARFIGPGVAGITLIYTSELIIFAVNTILYVWFFLSFWLLRLSETKRMQALSNGPVFQILQGYKYIYNHSLIGSLLLILAFVSLMTRPIVELLPVAAGSMFERDVEGLSWLMSAMGIGAMCAGYWIAQRGRIEGMPQITSNTILATALTLLVFSITQTFWVAVICMWALGFQYSTYSTCIQTMIQTVSEDHLRGRVLAVYGTIWIGCAALGALLVGGLADIFGLRLPLGGMTVLCVVVWLWSSSRLKQIDSDLKRRGII
tara:strand:- start:4626 stop:5879 length:1254 start_codon:yes stop_codon:yes gene_type:complete